MALAHFQHLVTRLVRAPDTLVNPLDIDRVIASAVRRYSQDRPRTLVRDVAWLEAGFFGPVPAELDVESRVLEAEYPVGEVPRELRQVAISIEPPELLRLVCEDSLPAGAVVRLEFTAAHQLGGAVDTVPAGDRDTVAAWAAYLLCRELSVNFSGERESSMGADCSNTESRARNYAARAKEYRAAYFSGLGLVDPATAGDGNGAPPAGAGAVTAWPSRLRPWFRMGA